LLTHKVKTGIVFSLVLAFIVLVAIALYADLPRMVTVLAHFRCVLVALGPNDAEHLFVGDCAGRLLPAPRGGQGFGYDLIRQKMTALAASKTPDPEQSA